MIWSEQNVCSSRRKVEELEKAYYYDTSKDDMEVEPEPNVYEQYEEYVNPIPHGGGWNADVISRLIYYGVKTLS